MPPDPPAGEKRRASSQLISLGLTILLVAFGALLLSMSEQGKDLLVLAGDDTAERIRLVAGSTLLFAIIAAQLVSSEVARNWRSLLAIAIAAALPTLLLDWRIGSGLTVFITLLACTLFNLLFIRLLAQVFEGRGLWGACVVAAVFLLLAGVWPAAVGGALGSAFVLSLTLAAYTTLLHGQARLSARLAQGDQPRGALACWAITSTPLIALMMVSFSVMETSTAFGWHYFDRVRTIAGAEPSPFPDLAQSHQAWLQRNANSPQAGTAAERPRQLVLVAAAGGGIRASYWTARVLAEIANEAPQFQDRLFAASGVSGGSLGLGIFYAALAEGPERCGTGGLSCVVRFHDSDFLAGPLTATIVGIPLNMLIPFAPMPSRSAALETGWELAWRNTLGRTLTGANRLAGELAALGPTPEAGPPILILNATSASSGDRLVSANVGTRDWFAPTGSCQVNLAERLALPVSAGMGASARFPGITGWGWFDTEDVAGCDIYEGVADGGFYDNYGAASLLDLLGALQRMRAVGASPGNTGPSAKPIVIQITSDPDAASACVLSLLDRDGLPDFEQCGKKAREDAMLPPNGWWFYRLFFDTDEEAKAYTARLWRNTTFMPGNLRYPGLLSVFMRARAASGIRVARLLRATTLAPPNAGCYYHFSMSGLENIPLGWTLSVTARKKIDESLAGAQNRATMAALVAELRSPSPGCGHGETGASGVQ